MTVDVRALCARLRTGWVGLTLRNVVSRKSRACGWFGRMLLTVSEVGGEAVFRRLDALLFIAWSFDVYYPFMRALPCVPALVVFSEEFSDTEGYKEMRFVSLAPMGDVDTANAQQLPLVPCRMV